MLINFVDATNDANSLHQAAAQYFSHLWHFVGRGLCSTACLSVGIQNIKICQWANKELSNFLSDSVKIHQGQS